MGTKTVSSAAALVTSISESADKEFCARMMRYRLAVSLMDSMVVKGIISPEEAAILQTTVAEKHGLSLCSIFL